MEVAVANKTTTLYTNPQDTAQRTRDYLAVTHTSIAAIAKAVSYSRTTMSRYLAGSYDSDVTELEARLEDYLAEHSDEWAGNAASAGVGTESFTVAPGTFASRKSAFFESRDAREVIGVCQSCQEFIGLGIVVGRSGYGKTHALKYYAKLPRVAYIECDDTMSSRDLVEAIEKALGIPNGYGTIWKRVNGIREFCNVNRGYLIIIDEADKLISKYTQKKMEILRAIFDQADVGIVIAGEPKLEAQIKSYLARMANRVDFYAALHGLTPSEVEKFLSGYRVEPEALSELIARACNLQTGCFRLLDRTLNNVWRILKDQNSDTITPKTIEQASSMMML